MKKFTRVLSLVLAVLMLFALTACGSGSSSGDGSIVMSYGDYTLSEKDYMYILSMFKSQMIDNYQSYFAQYGVSYDEKDILELKMSEDTTLAQYIEEVAIEFSQQMLIFEQLCADSGISITDEEDLNSISEYISDMEFAYGGTDLFQITLAKLGFNKSSIERFMRANINYELIYEYRYGDGGIAAIPEESVNKNFLENYIRYDGALYAYGDYKTGEEYTFEFTDDEIKAYFDTEFVKIRHILYMTVDKSGNKFSDDKIKEKKQKADAALASVNSGEKTLDDLKSENEDSGYEYVFTKGKMVEAFEKAAYEMAVGEVRLVETEYGYHLMEKLEKTEEDFSGTVKEDGKTEGGNKAATVSAMSAAKIRAEALELLAKLQNGELKEYPAESEDKEYYLPMEPQLINKNETTYATFIEMVSKIEEGTFAEKNFPGDATYVIRKLPLTEKDITADIYNKIEEDLAFTAFGEYVQSFYDKVTVNKEIIDKFDILTVPMLDSELYTFG